MKQIKLCGIGNALVDIFASINDQQFNDLNFEKGTMRLVEPVEQGALIEKVKTAHLEMVSGGSVGNSIIAFAQLGGKAAFLGSVGSDQYGEFYRAECKEFGIAFPSTSESGIATGTVAVLVTPDAERTMRTCLGAAGRTGPKHIDRQTIADSEMLFVEGYLLSNPDYGQQAIYKALEYAQRGGTKVALTCSEAWVVNGFRGAVDTVLAQANLVFANESEACALAGDATDGATAFKKLCARFENVVVTMGEKGALIRWNGEECKISAVPCKPVDLTGAGDMFAGTLLHGLLHGKTLQDSGKAAAALASLIISQVGARYSGDLRQAWQKAINN